MNELSDTAKLKILGTFTILYKCQLELKKVASNIQVDCRSRSDIKKIHRLSETIKECNDIIDGYETVIGADNPDWIKICKKGFTVGEELERQTT